MELVSAMAVDKQYTSVAFGDTLGHIRVLDISGGIDTLGATSCARSFKQVWIMEGAGGGGR
jgi:hypothetical protein